MCSPPCERAASALCTCPERAASALCTGLERAASAPSASLRMSGVYRYENLATLYNIFGRCSSSAELHFSRYWLSANCRRMSAGVGGFP